MVIALWIAAGIIGWAVFGIFGSDEKHSLWDEPGFYFGILPIALVCPMGVWAAVALLPFMTPTNRRDRWK